MKLCSNFDNDNIIVKKKKKEDNNRDKLCT